MDPAPRPDLPRPAGDRLAVIVGSGLHREAFHPAPTALDLTVTGSDGHDHLVELDDCGEFVVLRRHRSSDDGDLPTGATPAHRVDHHANIRALCESGCSRVLALSSVGSLRTDWGVGTVVVPDDFLAFSAYPTFHHDTDGHRVPGFDPDWRSTVLDAWRSTAGADIVDGGVYAETRGPRFETPAEVRMLAGHADLVGMTVASECILAGEADLAYAAVCKVDNLGNGLDGAPLTLDEYHTNTLQTMGGFVAAVARVIGELTGANT
jgi:purine nucleoside phosphorylase